MFHKETSIVQKNKAIVLLSGGIDSSTCLGIANEMGFDVYALTIDYGQRHRKELDSAIKIAKALGVKEHRVVQLDLRSLGGSSLISDLPVPKGRDILTNSEIPPTYVPARNTLFLSLALAHGEVLGAYDIFIGANQIDFSGYPDCREEYLKAFEVMANLALKATVEGKNKIKIHAPLLHMTKAEIIKKANSLGIDLSLTHSCYDPSPEGKACGLCDSCIIRKKGFLEANIHDPTEYLQ